MKFRYLALGVLVASCLGAGSDVYASSPKPTDSTKSNPKCMEWIAALNAAEMDVATQSLEFSKIVRDPAGGVHRRAAQHGLHGG